jgi:hypothetical protein
MDEGLRGNFTPWITYRRFMKKLDWVRVPSDSVLVVVTFTQDSFFVVVWLYCAGGWKSWFCVVCGIIGESFV